MSRKTIASVAAIATLMVGLTVSAGSVAAQTGPQGGDGTDSSTAGASCWGIKQQYPSSADGVYWLNNAALEAPERYYCDMTTDGGGWVLVGRGRNNWNFATEGQGTRATLRDAVDGPAAFSPATLPSDEIDRLLNNQPIESLPDGIRLRRAATADGSVRQEYRLEPRTFGRWSWGLDGGIVLDSITLDGVSYGTSNTRDTNAAWAGVGSGLQNNNNERRINTTIRQNKNYQGGFSLGSRYSSTNALIRGDQSSTNYLWEAGTEGQPHGFTQVFLRPQIANDQAGFNSLPPSGLGAETTPARLKNRAETAPWGVVGMDKTGEVQTEPWYTNALALKVVGDRVFVGGRFSGVQNGPNASPIAQPFLAAFDRNTGAWIDTFRPVLDGRVWDIQVAPDGNLYIGGDFTQVNGDANATGLAKINPLTGAVVTSWKGDLARVDSSGNRAIVRAIAVAGDGVYVAGNFNRVTGGTWNQITVTRAVKLNHTNGSPLSAWRPAPNGTVIDMDVTPAGDRVYLAGYFTAVGGDTTKGYFVGVNSSTGAPIPGQAPFQPSGGSNARYQQAVLVDGDHVYVGGSEHNIQKYRMSDNALVGNHITRQGGDAQALVKLGDDIFAGCHCGDILYSDTNQWNSPPVVGHSRLDPINLAGAFDETTFAYDRGWVPTGLKGDRGEGIWDFDQTPDQCLYVAGDLIRSGGGNDAGSWVGGFAKFCPDDSIAPTAPSNVSVTANGSSAVINFTPGADNSGTVQHWIYRNDRVIGTTWGSSFTDLTATSAARYTVRAVDNSRNKSATAPIVDYTPPAQTLGTLVPTGATWTYLDTGADPGAAWASGGFDDSSWASGAAPLGWEDPVATVIGAARPIVSYFRHDFVVADPDAASSLRLRVRRDDAAAVYLNGVEVARSNLPGGPLTNTTLAADYAWGAAETAFVEFTIPASLLQAGTNTIAVRLHQASAANGDASFELDLTAFAPTGDQTAPSTPVATATGGTGSIWVSWTPATDNALTGYLVRRDGAPVAFVPAGTTDYVDSGLQFSETHDYVVEAVDADGNSSASAPATATTSPNPAVLAFGSSWKWSYDGTAPAATWNTDGFDDSSWNTGLAELGYGDNDEATVLTTAAAPRPLVGYFRTTVDVADPDAFSTMLLEAVRDDGIAVYVNGVEVGRDNLPAGPVSNTTGAVTALSTRAQETTPVAFSVPSSAFRAGQNTIAVSVHNTDRWSGDLSFNLRITGVA